MSILSIDIETYSSVDLTGCGVYKYAESEDFEILLFAFAYNDDDVKVIDIASGEHIPPEIIQDIINNPIITKSAFNAQFERICLSKYLGVEMTADDWHCSMVHSTMLGLPCSLGAVGTTLGLHEDKQKLSTGKALIRYFCKPCAETKVNGGRIRNLPHHDPEKWDLFIAYNKQDVETERAIYKRIEQFPIPTDEHLLWCWDQRMNDYGITLDTELISNILNYNATAEAESLRQAKLHTRLDNPNSIAQLKKWIEDKEGFSVTSLTKDSIKELLEREDISEETKTTLRFRQEASKVSIKKYEAMERAVCIDTRLHGVLQFYGANRTGRWAGRLVQVHNLPQNKYKDIALARELVKENDFETLELLYPSVSNVLSQLIRTAFIPPDNHKFAIADYSAIEARVIAWLADEKWRQDVFATHGKIYEASAAQMFGVSLDEVTKDSDYRKKGKVAELALGYGGGLGALKTMGGEDMGLSDPEMETIVKKWRAASPRIVKMWKDVENAVRTTIKERKSVSLAHGISTHLDGGILFIQLPSGRRLAYTRPRVEGYSISYEGMEQTSHTWGRQSTYGGKLVENIVQATARDCLAVAMLRISDAGYNIVMHVHDEVIVEVNDENAEEHQKKLELIMSQPICWADGLILTADGFVSDFYKKD